MDGLCLASERRSLVRLKGGVWLLYNCYAGAFSRSSCLMDTIYVYTRCLLGQLPGSYNKSI